MGSLAFALLLAGLLWLAATDAPRFVLAALALAGLPMEVLTGGARFLSGPLEVDAEALYMFGVLAGCALIVTMRTARAFAVVMGVPAVLLFLAGAAASFGWTEHVVYGLRMFVKLLTPVLFMWTVTLAAAEGLEARAVARAVYAAAALLVALAVLNLVTHGALGPLPTVPGFLGLPQLAAPYTSPSNFSFALAVAALLAIGEWSQRRRAAPLLLAGLLLGAIAFSLCRAAIGGLLGGFLVFAIVGRAHAWRRLAIAVVAVVTAAAVLFSLPEFRHRMFFDADAVSWSSAWTDPRLLIEHLDTSGRDGLWQAAREDFRDSSPWLGSGIGAVDRWIRDRDVRGSELHSDLYRLYLDLGIVGLTLFGCALLSIVAAVRRVGRRAVDSDEPYSVQRVALGSLACYVTTLATDNSLNYVANFAVMVFGLLGLALAGRISAARAEAAPAAARPRRFAHLLE